MSLGAAGNLAPANPLVGILYPAIGAGGGLLSDFFAFGEDANGVIKALVRGTGTTTFVNASTVRTLQDAEGLIRPIPANCLRPIRGRIVENLYRYANHAPADWTTGNWTFSGGAAQVSLSGTILTVSGLNGANDRVNFEAVNSRVALLTTGVHDYRYRLRVRGAANDTLRFYIRLTGGTNETLTVDVTLTGDWDTIVSGIITNTQGNSSLDFRIRGATGVAGNIEIDFATVQAEDVTGQTVTVPADLVPVDGVTNHGLGLNGIRAFAYENDSTVDANNILTEIKGTAITDWKFLFEPAATNVVHESEDFTTGAGDWTVSSGASTQTSSTSTQSPIQGVTWWRLESSNSGSSSDRSIFSNTHTKDAAAETWIGSAIVEGDEVGWIEISVENGSAANYARQYINLTTGATGTSSVNVWSYDGAGAVQLSTGKWRVWIKSTTNTDTGIRLRLRLAEDDSDTVINLNVGEGLNIIGAMLAEEKALSSYVATAGADVSRTADDAAPIFDNTAGANADVTKGTYVADFTAYGANTDLTTTDQLIVGLHDISNASLHFQDSAGNRSWDGTTIAPNTQTWSDGDEFRIAIYWEASVTNGWRVGFKNGGSYTWGSQRTMDANGFTDGSVISVGRTLQVPIEIRDLKIWKESKGEQWVEDNL